MRERRNDPEIMEDRAIACTTQLGSISSLRCQKTRSRRPLGQPLRSDVSRTNCFNALLSQAIVSIKPSGGARRDRTDDLMLAKHALSQLSYGPVPEDECRFVQRSPSLVLRRSSLRSRKACRAAAAQQRRLVGLGRLELPTSRLSSARSNQLSYKPVTLYSQDKTVLTQDGARRTALAGSFKPTTTAR